MALSSPREPRQRSLYRGLQGSQAWWRQQKDPSFNIESKNLAQISPYIYILKPVPTIHNLMLFNIYIYHVSVFSWSFLIPLVMPFFSKGCSWDATALARWSTVSDTCEAFNSQTGRWELTLQALLRCFRQIECDQCRHILWWYGGPMAYSYIIYDMLMEPGWAGAFGNPPVMVPFASWLLFALFQGGRKDRKGLSKIDTERAKERKTMEDWPSLKCQSLPKS